MNKWKSIWEKREIKEDNSSILSRLISADGFDTGFGTILESDWIAYVEYISNKLNLKESDSIYEVGCGSGAFLYYFYKKGHKVGGVDYSSPLIKIAKKYISNKNFSLKEANQLTIVEKYDYVVSNGVFFYFSSHTYAKDVLSLMLKKANKGIAILEVNDFSKKEESMKLRKGYLSDEEYNKRYKGLEHLYYKKEWFLNFAKEYNLKIDIEQQNINNYTNNMYRFNVFIRI